MPNTLEENKKVFSLKLKKLMDEWEIKHKEKLTQAKLAGKIGVARETVCSWITGRAVPSSPVVINSICSFFQIYKGYLLSDAQDNDDGYIAEEQNDYSCVFQTSYKQADYEQTDEMEWIGSYVAYNKPPETEAKKAKMISNAVASIMKKAAKLVENGAHVDWNTTTIIVKEGIDVFNRSPDWYMDEPSVTGWRMTVGIKIKADPLK